MEPSRYGPFPYSPINKRSPLRFPNGERVALWVIPNLEVFHLDTPMPGDTLQRPGSTPGAQVPMVREWAQRDYGNRVGVFRMIEVMERYGVRGTVALNSDLCDAHPEIIEDTRALGWEFMGHGKTNTHRQNEIPPQDERQHVLEIFDRIERATGTRPVGWLGPGLQETWNTLDYLLEAGCEYVADWVNDDQPYYMSLSGERLVSIPYSYEANDSVSIVRNKNTPNEFERIIRDQFDVMYKEGESSGRVLAICLHPYVIGQPHRIGALDRALAHICAHAGVWKATGSEIVRHCVATGQVLE